MTGGTSRSYLVTCIALSAFTFRKLLQQRSVCENEGYRLATAAAGLWGHLFVTSDNWSHKFFFS